MSSVMYAVVCVVYCSCNVMYTENVFPHLPFLLSHFTLPWSKGPPCDNPLYETFLSIFYIPYFLSKNISHLVECSMFFMIIVLY